MSGALATAGLEQSCQPPALRVTKPALLGLSYQGHSGLNFRHPAITASNECFLTDYQAIRMKNEGGTLCCVAADGAP